MTSLRSLAFFPALGALGDGTVSGAPVSGVPGVSGAAVMVLFSLSAVGTPRQGRRERAEQVVRGRARGSDARGDADTVVDRAAPPQPGQLGDLRADPGHPVGGGDPGL